MHVTPVRRRIIQVLCTIALAGTGGAGCSHYRLPVSRLESPEARGHTERFVPASLEAGFMSGTDLEGRPETRTDSEGVTTTSMPAAWTPELGFALSLSERTDLGIRFQPFAPLSFRLKYQFSGEPQSRARQGNFSTAVVVAPGILLGHAQSGASASYFLGDLTLIAGYRAWERHLFSLAPYFSTASLSGLTVTGASQYGAALGYQYQIEALMIRAELALASGTVGTASIGGFHFGVQFGLALDPSEYRD